MGRIMEIFHIIIVFCEQLEHQWTLQLYGGFVSTELTRYTRAAFFSGGGPKTPWNASKLVVI